MHVTRLFALLPTRLVLLALGLMTAGVAATTDLASITRPGPRRLIWLGSDFVLDWDPPTGAHNIWRYNAALSGQTDPLPGNAVVTGAWSGIRAGHELVYLGKQVVLDWQPLTGAYQLWHFDSKLTGAVDPLPGPAIAAGAWQSIRTGHKLIYLGAVGGGASPDRVLDWEPGSGHYRVWVYDRAATGATDPFPGSAVTEGTWSTVHTGHELVALEDGRVLDWEPQTGHFRVWTFDAAATGSQDPLPSPPHNEGVWFTVNLGHVLIPLTGRGRVLDWEPVTGRNRVWSYDSAATGTADPLASAVTSWTWTGVRSSTPPVTSASAIKHLVLIVQENHSFDAYFGNYCTGLPGAPVCETGSGCCERGPKTYSGIPEPHRLNDQLNGSYGPPHKRPCETAEIDRLSATPMDGFVTNNKNCGSSYNFSYAWGQDVALYWSYAQSYSMADRYFQPLVGASAANDIYFAAANWYFDDNDQADSKTFAAICCLDAPPKKAPNIGAVLWNRGVDYAVYAEGYTSGDYQSGDNPFAYFADPRVQTPGDPDWTFTRDVRQLAFDLEAGALPPVSFVKAQNAHSEHPGDKVTILDGIQFVKSVVDQIAASPFASSTLLLLTYDESGGYYDHVTPPADNATDNQPYGARVPLLAIGPFARPNHVSHVQMEHSSIVKFIEWNWLNQKTGQLGKRDADGHVNNIGSMLDPAKTGTPVPE